MRSILAIFRDDLRNTRRNLIAWVLILGLSVVPCLYAWFNISASWDPYGRTGQLKIALVNEDDGYDGNLIDVNINLGDTLISQISTSKKFDWVITDKEDAIEKTRSGKYYAAVEIPDSFSADMMSIFSSDAHHSDLIYYSNEKSNAIATMITEKGARAIQQEIDETFTTTIMEIAIATMKDLTDEGNIESASEMIGNMSTMIRHVADIMNTANGTIGTLSEATSSIDDMLEGTIELAESEKNISDSARALADETDKNITAISNDANTEIKELESILLDLKSLGLSDLDGVITKVETLKTDLETLQSDLKSVKSTSDSTVDDLDDVCANIIKASKSTSKSLNTLNSALKDTKKLLNKDSKTMNKLADEMDAAVATGDTTALKTVLSQDTGSLAKFLAAPVSLNRIQVYPVDNYGSAMAPFYTSLAIWVGAIILMALVKVGMSDERRRRLSSEGYRINETTIYFGRYIVFLVIGLMQALLTCIGDIYYLGIQCEHPLLFIIAGLYSSIVFGSITYTLVVSFGDIGKAASIVLMVMQVAGSGGTFPIEMTPGFFRMMYPLLPFNYSMTAMREAIAGTYGNTYIIALGKLSIFLVLALLLGLIFRRPLIKLNRMFHEAIDDTKIM